MVSGAAREADFVIASGGEGFVVASEWRALMVGAMTKAGLFCAIGGEGFVEVAAGMPLEKQTAEEVASEVEDFVAAAEAGFGGGAALWAGLLCASEEEGFVLPREERALRVLLQEMQASGEVPRQRRACSVPSLRRRALGGR